MGLFKKKPGSVPNRAASPNRRPVRSAEDWMPKPSVGGAKSAPSQNSFPATKGIADSIDKSIAERKKTRPSGGWVTAEGGRAISTERM